MFSSVFSIPLAPTDTGLTLKAGIVGVTGLVVAFDIASGFSEFGLGKYQWYYASFTNGQRGSVNFYTGNYSGSIGQVWTNTGITFKASAPINASDEMVLADGSINSAKFSIAAVGNLATYAANGILEKLTMLYRWFYAKHDLPVTDQIQISGLGHHYADDNTTVIGKQTVTDDGVGVQTIGAIQDP